MLLGLINEAYRAHRLEPGSASSSCRWQATKLRHGPTASKWLITARLAQSGSRGDVVPPRLGGQR